MCPAKTFKQTSKQKRGGVRLFMAALVKWLCLEVEEGLAVFSAKCLYFFAAGLFSFLIRATVRSIDFVLLYSCFVFTID